MVMPSAINGLPTTWAFLQKTAVMLRTHQLEGNPPTQAKVWNLVLPQAERAIPMDVATVTMRRQTSKCRLC
jgi:hypothetical protein